MIGKFYRKYVVCLLVFAMIVVFNSTLSYASEIQQNSGTSIVLDTVYYEIGIGETATAIVDLSGPSDSADPKITNFSSGWDWPNRFEYAITRVDADHFAIRVSNIGVPLDPIDYVSFEYLSVSKTGHLGASGSVPVGRLSATEIFTYYTKGVGQVNVTFTVTESGETFKIPAVFY